ncbi:hypothetical protein QQS21_012188 [Conoideocrella luteorostrata]|uniref:AB hydrolase-1 domain-containing protein n=1 Tax=Conoideocrella luteorostrata TaxID=1105319 RepID=A0AAJ0CBN6_9HYPO|nr:hypothetical protein QQS21_012188 [Conoideocrella luteorostrata]
MASQTPLRNSFTTSKTHTYSYIHIPPATAKPTLFFLHGFPSHIPDWTYQVSHFSSLGYGILACDLLGFGQSSKPSDPCAYRLKPVSEDLVELLDAVGLDKAVGVGHDIGATILSRLAAYHPDRFLALVFLAVGPPKLGTPFHLESINEMTRKFMGFELLGYIDFLTSDGAQTILEKNAPSAMSLIFAENTSQVWREWFHPLHKMEEFVVADSKVPIGEWYTDELQKAHLEAYGREGGYTGATRWYRMWRDNLFARDEEGYEGALLKQPCLLVAPKGAEQQAGMLAEWASKLEVVYIESGHWMNLEKSEGTNSAVEEFLDTI